MTIKEVAQLTGLTHQAIYKKIKANGLRLDNLKDKTTGQLTAEGEAIIKDLFCISEPPPAADATEVEKLTTTVAELTTEVEKLRNQVANQAERITALTEERDFLRTALDQAQKLQAITLAKVPSAPALPSGEKKKRGLFGWFSKKGGDSNAD